jgi:hypothetical protein
LDKREPLQGKKRKNAGFWVLLFRGVQVGAKVAKNTLQVVVIGVLNP